MLTNNDEDCKGNMVNPKTEIQSNKTCDPVSGRTVSKHREQNCASVTVAVNTDVVVAVLVVEAA